MNEKRITQIPSGVSQEEWLAWVNTQGVELSELGIRDEVLSSESNWADFLANGEIYYRPGTVDFNIMDVEIKHLHRRKEIFEGCLAFDGLFLHDSYRSVCRRLKIATHPE